MSVLPFIVSSLAHSYKINLQHLNKHRLMSRISLDCRGSWLGESYQEQCSLLYPTSKNSIVYYSLSTGWYTRANIVLGKNFVTQILWSDWSCNISGFGTTLCTQCYQIPFHMHIGGWVTILGGGWIFVNSWSSNTSHLIFVDACDCDITCTYVHTYLRAWFLWFDI